jgi:hypothetical protein
MRLTLTLLCILGVSLAGSSQDKNFDLSKYKFPDYKRHQLEFNFNSSGNSNSYFVEIPQTTNMNATTYDNANFRFNSNFTMWYSYDYLTLTRIDHFFSSLNGQFDYFKSKNSGNKTKESEPGMNWNFNGFRRIYLTEDKVFLEGVTDFQYYYTNRKVTNDDANTVFTDRYTSSNLTLSVGMGVGIGRIERVNDLWQGYYILEKLNQQNSLIRELKDNDIFEFAGFVSKLKNKRFFDARLQKIAELQSLDSLLHQQNLIRNSDISYFTTLNDYWSFPIYFDRKSGRELKFQLLPEVTSEYYKSNNTTSDSPTKANLVSKIQFDCSRQLNLFWERNAHIDFINTTLFAKNGDVSDSYPGNLFRTNVLFGYGFFPDSRTRFKLSGNYSGYEGLNFNGEIASKSWVNNTSLNFEASYYISPQLQITGNFSGNYWFSKHNSSHGQGTNFNLGFRYAIF